jgi:hypothetical protein
MGWWRISDPQPTEGTRKFMIDRCRHAFGRFDTARVQQLRSSH